ncbi:MAG: hypothetical protein V7641_2891 [Blastocatellia bacterium]
MKRKPKLQTIIRYLIGNLLCVTLYVACAASASAQILPPNSYQLTLHSEPGDPWSRGGKHDWFYQVPGAQFFIHGGDLSHNFTFNWLYVVVRSTTSSTDFWSVTVHTPGEMTPGSYSASNFPGSVGINDLDVEGQGGACIGRSGSFTILQLEYEPVDPGNGVYNITRFAATFEQHCYGQPPALRGSVYFNSNGFPPPPKLLMKQRPPLPDATVGSDYSQNFEAEGGTPPYNWTIDSRPLPPGLGLDNNGVIRGVPTTPGKYSFQVIVSDSAPLVTGYPVQINTTTVSITVNPSVFSISDGLPPTATKDIGYAYQFAAHGGSPPYHWSLIDGKLPPGLTLSDGGKLSGIPSSPGMFNFTLRAADSTEQKLEKVYAIKVIDPPHISTATYKAKKRKLVIFGENFDALATLWIDGQEVKPKSHDSESFVVKALSLSPETHDLRVVNPDGGAASVTITVQ